MEVLLSTPLLFFSRIMQQQPLHALPQSLQTGYEAERLWK
jgi:hypothetical protein